MSERTDRPGGFPIDRTEAALAVGYLVALVAIGALIALALGRSPGPFLDDLFADPIWLFGTGFGPFIVLKACRKRRGDSEGE